MEFIDHLAALIPPPRLHRHRYHGVLAPNAPLRLATTAYERDADLDSTHRHPPFHHPLPRRQASAPPRTTCGPCCSHACSSPLPLVCPCCGADMRIVAFITETALRRILTHIGEPAEPPRIAPARGPPAWDDPPVDLVPSRSSTVTDRTRPAAKETPSRALAFSPLVW